ncbi:MAG TPA: hypothetical protein VEH27_18665 [Methylomirabilota bacterium]|nr:hypothetical protein [Methylomirabilota bacterium]
MPRKSRALERRTLKKFQIPAPGRKTAASPSAAHNVYVIRLDGVVGDWLKAKKLNPNRNPNLPCVYVGMTGLAPEERFANHKAGVKAAAVVKYHGQKLLPELFAHLNPMPYDVAVVMERELAEDLRAAGYTVFGGK